MRLLKEMVLRGLGRALRSERGRQIALEVTRPLGVATPRGMKLALDEQPYHDLAQPAEKSGVALHEDVVFITARFRSGSTLLWNLLRNIDGITAYYEPFNERRWFDPAKRGTLVDRTHRQVGDYWQEYDGLAELSELYDEDWIRRDLYMDEHAWAPRMKRYVERLIAHAPGRPVLQFNRIDFRLTWFRRHFPRARLVHLYRHPRDQWCSTLINLENCPRQARLVDFTPHDHYYLLTWAADLQTHFPFLRPDEIRHPYELFYLIWRLSYLFGTRFAGHSVCFEHLLENPDSALLSLFDYLSIQDVDIDRLKSLLSPPAIGKWRTYADEFWFRNAEERCELMLADFFGGVHGNSVKQSEGRCNPDFCGQ